MVNVSARHHRILLLSNLRVVVWLNATSLANTQHCLTALNVHQWPTFDQPVLPCRVKHQQKIRIVHHIT
jgi:hypothetical protein